MGHEKGTCDNSQTTLLCKYRARKIHLGYFVFLASRTTLLSLFLPKEFLLLPHPQEAQPGQHHNTGVYSPPPGLHLLHDTPGQDTLWSNQPSTPLLSPCTSSFHSLSLLPLQNRDNKLCSVCYHKSTICVMGLS